VQKWLKKINKKELFASIRRLYRVDVDCQQSAPEANLGQGLQMNEFRSFFSKNETKIVWKNFHFEIVKVVFTKGGSS